MSMLTQQINELESHNYFYSAYYSDKSANSRNLGKIGFMPPFHMPKLNDKSPDFLIVNGERKYAIVVECKSGRFQIDDTIQCRKYRAISLRSVEEEARKFLRDPGFALESHDFVIQYYDNMISHAEKNHKGDFSELLSENHVVSCKKGGLYQLYTSEALMDEDTHSLLELGIEVPVKVQPSYTMLDDPCLELICFSIIHYAFKFVALEKTDVALNLEVLMDDGFCHYRVDPKKIGRVLEILNKLGVCRKEKGEEAGVKTILPGYHFGIRSLIKGKRVIDAMHSGRSLADISANGLSSLDDFSESPEEE